MKFEFEEILSLIEVLLDEKISDIPLLQGKRGVRGPKGLDGQDGINGQDGLNGRDGRDGIDGKDGKDGVRGPRGLKGQKGDVGPKGEKGDKGEKGERGEIGPKGEQGERGPRGFKGSPGLDGKSFIWEDHKDEILSKIKDSSLKFEHLTQEQIQELRGPRGFRGQKGKSGLDGKDGQDGKNFEWEEHKEKILEHLNTLKLKFDDLTEDEKESLRGFRGPRGQRGKQGEQGEKGEKGDTGLTGAPGIRGLRGEDGKDGKDGIDGKDAPIIIDIELEEWNDYIYFVFYFDDGRKIETKRIERPVINQLVQQIVAGGGGGYRCYQSTNIEYDAQNRPKIVRDYIDSDKQFMGRREEIFYSGNFVDYTIESIWNAQGSDENLPNELIIEKKIDIIYTGNFVTDIKVIDV